MSSETDYARCIDLAKPRPAPTTRSAHARLALRADHALARHEPEYIVRDVAAALEEGDSAWRSVKGIGYRDDGQVVLNELYPFIENLDELPFPAWDLLPFDKYDELNSPHGSIEPGASRRYAPIMTSRGCPFQCFYCHNSEEKLPESLTGNTGILRLKSIDRVMEEVKKILSLGVTHIYLEDDILSFLLDDYYPRTGLPLAGFHPIFIIDHAISASQYRNEDPVLTEDLVKDAMDNILVSDSEEPDISDCTRTSSFEKSDRKSR